MLAKGGYPRVAGLKAEHVKQPSASVKPNNQVSFNVGLKLLSSNFIF
jgi:hypothetical protein